MITPRGAWRSNERPVDATATGMTNSPSATRRPCLSQSSTVVVRCLCCDHATVNSALPDGWTIERVRSVSGDQRAIQLSPERLVVLDVGQSDYTILRPDIVLAFG